MSTSIFRQGDVYLHAIPTVQNLGQPLPIEPRGVVLAHGEVTGHAHTLDPVYCQLYPLPPEFQTDATHVANGRILRVVKEIELRHEEHSPISLKPGDYYVGIQIEWDESNQWRKVAD